MAFMTTSELHARPTILSEMEKLVGTREVGHNRGSVIDAINRQAGNALGSPYCAAAINYAAIRSGCVSPRPSRPGLALNWRTSASWSARAVLDGSRPIRPDDLVIWRVGDTWRGHIAVVKRVIDRQWIVTVTANSSCSGSGDDRDGDGICRKRYRIQPYSYFGIKYISRPVYDKPPGGSS